MREWQICDLFPNGDNGVTTVNDDNGEPVDLATEGLARLLRGLHDAGIGAEHFPWPPPDESTRAPYRGWQPMDDADAAVFFGRDCQILRGMDTLRGMRTAGVEGLFVILGPSGVGKSSFLRAGLLPRLRRDPGNFLVSEIVRPDRDALAGDRGLAQAIWQLRAQAGPGGPALGEVKTACREADIARLTSWIHEAQREATDDGMAPTVVLPIDQGEELFSAEAGTEATTFLSLLGGLLQTDAIGELPLIAAMTIRADRYESLQNAPELLAVHPGVRRPQTDAGHRVQGRDHRTGRPRHRGRAAAEPGRRTGGPATHRHDRGCGQPAATRSGAVTAVPRLRQHRATHPGQLRGHGWNGAHRRSRDQHAAGQRTRPARPAAGHIAQRLHPLAGHHRSRNRLALETNRALGRTSTGEPDTDRRDGRPATAREGRARGRDRRRSGLGKPTAAMGLAGPVAGNTHRISRPPTAWTARPPTGSSTSAVRNGCSKACAWPRPSNSPTPPCSANGSVTQTNSCGHRGTTRTPRPRPSDNGRRTSYAMRRSAEKRPRRTRRPCVRAPGSCAHCSP